MGSPAILLFLLAGLLLLLLNAFFVLAEFAAVKIRGSRIEEMEDQGLPGAGLVRRIHDHLDEYLSVCQVGITVASIALGFVGESFTAGLLRPLLGWLGWGASLGAHVLATGAAVAFVSGVHILLGEQVPKLVALRTPDRWALATARPLIWSRALLYLPLLALNSSTALILRLLRVPAMPEHETVSEDELRIILERSQSGGLLSFRRLLFMENIFDLGGLKVRDAMRPRAQVQCLRQDMDHGAVLDFVRAWRYSRYPWLPAGAERPSGFVHVKDILLAQGAPGGPVDLSRLVRPILSTAETVPLEVLLAEMQRKRVHAALVAGQDGAWTGFIAMEDIIEEIIGTVDDEFATDPPLTLAETLSIGRVVLGVEAATIALAVRTLLSRVPAGDLPAAREAIQRAVEERERLASTYLGRAVAMPHARLAGLEKPAVLLGRSEKGIPVKGPAGERARLLFVLLTPAGQPRVHQRLQARIVRLLESSDYVEDRLREAATPQEVLEAIRTGELASLD